MQKKLLAVAVAGVLAAPAVAFAQSSVTISGVLNFWMEGIKASGSSAPVAAGASNPTGNVISRTRVADASGSNIRFAVVEDLGAGLSAIGQVETAIFCGGDTRNNSAGAGYAGVGATANAPQSACGWGVRETFVGLNSKSWGAIRLGTLNVHYTEHLSTDDFTTRTTTNHGIWTMRVGIMGQGPSFGSRYGNVLRYTSPTWSGFDFITNYARPTDGAPGNPSTAVPTLATARRDQKNNMWQVGLRYNQGPISAGYSYFRDKDITLQATPYAFLTTAAPLTAPTAMGAVGAAMGLRSDLMHGSYKFPMGIKIGLVWDRSRATVESGAVATDGNVKRTVWGIPLQYRTGSHEFAMNYAKAREVTGTIGTAGILGSGTGGTMWTMGYAYHLSKRSNLHFGYHTIRNGNFGTSGAANGGGAAYSYFANSAGNAGGADPRSWTMGMYHAF